MLSLRAARHIPPHSLPCAQRRHRSRCDRDRHRDRTLALFLLAPPPPPPPPLPRLLTCLLTPLTHLLPYCCCPGADEIQRFTFDLCHLYARCTKIVSSPAPTYYAHLAAHNACTRASEVANCVQANCVRCTAYGQRGGCLPPPLGSAGSVGSRQGGSVAASLPVAPPTPWPPYRTLSRLVVSCRAACPGGPTAPTLPLLRRNTI